MLHTRALGTSIRAGVNSSRLACPPVPLPGVHRALRPATLWRPRPCFTSAASSGDVELESSISNEDAERFEKIAASLVARLPQVPVGGDEDEGEGDSRVRRPCLFHYASYPACKTASDTCMHPCVHTHFSHQHRVCVHLAVGGEVMAVARFQRSAPSAKAQLVS